MPHVLDIVTCNVMAEGVVTTGFHDWAERRDGCCRVLRALGADLVALQECIGRQQDDLAAAFPEFVGVSSDLSGADESVRAPVRARLGGAPFPETGELLTLFRRDAFRLVERREAWLSPTPERISVGFGNVSPRALMAVRLQHRASGRELAVANAHLDLRCPEPMAAVALDRLDAWFGGAIPQIWCGDFNAGLGTATADRLRAAGWSAPETDPDDWRGERVDHVWHRGPGLTRLGARVVDAEHVVPALSDHDPVIVRFALADR